jgi:hypothetical protein
MDILIDCFQNEPKARETRETRCPKIKLAALWMSALPRKQLGCCVATKCRDVPTARSCGGMIYSGAAGHRGGTGERHITRAAL